MSVYSTTLSVTKRSELDVLMPVLWKQAIGTPAAFACDLRFFNWLIQLVFVIIIATTMGDIDIHISKIEIEQEIKEIRQLIDDTI